MLFFYSIKLAIVALLSLPLYVLVSESIRPTLRSKINERFNTGAASQQFLVEAIFGIETLKASAVEPSLRYEWEERLASYVKSSFQALVWSSAGQGAISLISKLTTVSILFLGAQAVMQNDLSIGGFIAFNMILSQMTAPILRLSQLWQDFQQVRISIDRIGDILNSEPESKSLALSNMPAPTGKISVDDVSFRYKPNTPEIIKSVSFNIEAGTTIGLYGASGSGKSTLTKLFQGLYRPEKGRILLDGIDISQVDSAWLRRQIGVVLQENVLFNRSIHDNIALVNPAMHRSQVIEAARLAGADEFISRLPLGFDTIIEERGSNLSGGQRQRIALARALITDPKILILDEATSALDLESEQLIRRNMKEISRGRTVIIIAHRLAALRGCNILYGMKDGEVMEQGSHQDLISNPDTLYSRLWLIQSENLDD
jgi:subfamily B ATP-binding cassette protein HlyB/CyaB